MTPDISLAVLLAPMVIAGVAVAMMIVVTGGRRSQNAVGPREASSELGYAVDEGEAIALTPARYVGGHPELGAPLASPYILITSRDLALFKRKGSQVVFTLPWAKVDSVSRLTAPQMTMAASSVRGLAPGALDDLAEDAVFARVRFEDERGWWQNVIFELSRAFADQQYEEVVGRWHLSQANAASAAIDVVPPGAEPPAVDR